MIASILSKFLAPTLIGIVLGVGGILGLQHLQPKPEVKVECPQPVCPQPKCDCSGNAIDIEKLKGFKGTFSINQHYHVEMNGDSLVVKKIISEMEAKLKELRLARCK